MFPTSKGMAVAYFQAQRQRCAQGGAVSIIVVAMLFVILGLCGMAIDLSMMLNRRVELQNLADATALAAAAELDGTPEGVARALANAATTAGQLRIQYGLSIDWTDAAVHFANLPGRDAEWVAAEVARGAPDGRLYVRVDTGALGDATGLVSTVFMKVLSSSRGAVMQGIAVAGRTGIRVTPLAICANSKDAAAPRPVGSDKELIEFGFRRGVSYNLMKLNPNGTAAENFLVDPFTPPGATSAAAPATDVVGPYICTGTMSMPRVTGGAITVTRTFPLAAFAKHLNSRFDQTDETACSRFSAPPDANVKRYPYTAIPWMTTLPLGQAATTYSDGAKLQTVADPSPAPATNTAGAYGPLWSYAKAVRFSAYVQDAPEPAAGYATFGSSDWSTLYDPGRPVANNYTAVPYQATTGGNFLASTGILRGSRNRRVLHIPLLACPIAAGATAPANVLGIGKFFMTVPVIATANDLFAEFAGTVPDQALGATVGLFP